MSGKTSAAPLRLFLVRHGETEWSLSGQHTGRSDILLTPRGETEALRLAPWLSDVAFSAVFSSPRQRARRTCDLVLPNHPAEIAPELAEWDYGAFEGLRGQDIRGENPGWDIYRDGCPGGESPADIAARADGLIARLNLLAGNVALFSHGHFGRVLAACWIKQPIGFARHLTLGTACLSILSHDPGHAETRVIALWNAAPATVAGG